MCWLKRGMWKVGIVVASILFFLLLFIGISVSTVSAQGSIGGAATPTPATVQATPTVDATLTALNKEKLQQDIAKDQSGIAKDRSDLSWAWTSSGTIVVGIVGAVFTFFQFLRSQQDRADERRKEKEAQDKDLRDKVEERFKTAVAALGDEKEGVQVGGAILLRSFLNKDDKWTYERYYIQIFDLAVAYLRLRRTSHPPEDPNTPLPLSQALSVIFKEAFPLARDRFAAYLGPSQFNPQALDASRIQLDNAYLSGADLKQIWMPQASLRKADLSGATLRGADLGGANLEGAILQDTNLHGVKGLTEEQLKACKAKGAIIDEAPTDGAPQSPVAPSPPPQQSS